MGRLVAAVRISNKPRGHPIIAGGRSTTVWRGVLKGFRFFCIRNRIRLDYMDGGCFAAQIQ